MEGKTKAQEKQILALQQQNIELKDTNLNLERQLIQLQGTLKLFKEDSKSSVSSLEKSQAEYLHKRAESVGNIERKVLIFIVGCNFYLHNS